jgi:hypothetical protein
VVASLGYMETHNYTCTLSDIRSDL